MHWEVHWEQGFCTYGPTLCVYVDPRPIVCGAIRCIGPFGSSNLSKNFVLGALRELTLLLEAEYLKTSQFVLWGAYSESWTFEEHTCQVLDSAGGFVPAVWLRGHLLREVGIDREWLVRSSAAIHKTGLLLPNLHDSFLDAGAFHPDTAQYAVYELHRFAALHLCSLDQPTRLPIARWSPRKQKVQHSLVRV